MPKHYMCSNNNKNTFVLALYMGSCLCGLPTFPPGCIVAEVRLTVTKCPLGKSCWPPLCLESEQLFVFNLSKLSWEFKPFVVAVNSTFFKSPASSSRVSATLKHTSTNTAAAGNLGKHFSTRGSLVARVGRKNIAPFLFFSTRTRVILLHSRPVLCQSGRGTIEVCNTQRAPPDMASISCQQQSSEWNQAGRCRRRCCCILYRLHLWIPALRHYPCTDLCISTFSICSEWHTGICEGREISVVASIPARKIEIEGNKVKERESCKILSVANCKLYVYYLGREFIENFL